MKGQGYGGKRWVNLPWFRGYITARINPERRMAKAELREMKRSPEYKALFKGKSEPPRIKDNGRLAVSFDKDVERGTLSGLERTARNRASTKIANNRNLKKKLLSQHGTMAKAVTAFIEQYGLASLLTDTEQELMGQLLGG